MQPTLVVHADWGTAPYKRWMASAMRRNAGWHTAAWRPASLSSTPGNKAAQHQAWWASAEAVQARPSPSTDARYHFDAVIGLFGMLNAVLGHRPAGAPDDQLVRRAEGWIFGSSLTPKGDLA